MPLSVVAGHRITVDIIRKGHYVAPEMSARELTPRQAEVQRLRDAGLSAKQIAGLLNVWPQAVYAIFRRIDEGTDAPDWAAGRKPKKVPA